MTRRHGASSWSRAGAVEGLLGPVLRQRPAAWRSHARHFCVPAHTSQRGSWSRKRAQHAHGGQVDVVDHEDAARRAGGRRRRTSRPPAGGRRGCRRSARGRRSAPASLERRERAVRRPHLEAQRVGRDAAVGAVGQHAVGLLLPGRAAHVVGARARRRARSTAPNPVSSVRVPGRAALGEEAVARRLGGPDAHARRRGRPPWGARRAGRRGSRRRAAAGPSVPLPRRRTLLSALPGAAGGM